MKALFWKTIISFVVALIIAMLFYFKLDQHLELWFFQLPRGQFFHFCSHIIYYIFLPEIWLLIGIVTLVVGCVLFLKSNVSKSKPWLFYGISLVGTFILSGLIKFIVGRYRPDMYFIHNLYGLHFFSMKHDYSSLPSGHTAMSFAGLYALAVLVRRWWFTILCFALATFIAYSRLVALAHYASDVIIAAYIGIVVVAWTKHLVLKR
jgi:membrane-associated phospholipid phosphatase